RRALDGEQVETVHEIDGRVFETTYQPIVNEETGDIEQVIGVAVDVTERREYEEALTALHDATDEIVDADSEDAVYEILVEAGERILGFDLVAVDAATDGHLEQVACNFDPEEYPHHERTSLADDDTFGVRAYRQGETIVVDDIAEYDITPADPAYLSGLTVPIGEYGVFQGISPEAAAFDETDRELAEILVEHARAKLGRLADRRRLTERTATLEHKNDRLEQFTSFVSHDLRNPLNVAQLELELAARECDSDHLDSVADSHDRMASLIDDLLVFTRSDRTVESTEPMSLASVAEMSWTSVDTADATLVVETDTWIEADRGRLQQLFENLFHRDRLFRRRRRPRHPGRGARAGVRVGVLDEPVRDRPGPGDRRRDRRRTRLGGSGHRKRGRRRSHRSHGYRDWARAVRPALCREEKRKPRGRRDTVWTYQKRASGARTSSTRCSARSSPSASSSRRCSSAFSPAATCCSRTSPAPARL
ncbi:hypothetical protein BRC66_01930, partial [Halobacteriales archaeon QH_2_66_30]